MEGSREAEERIKWRGRGWARGKRATGQGQRKERAAGLWAAPSKSLPSLQQGEERDGSPGTLRPCLTVVWNAPQERQAPSSFRTTTKPGQRAWAQRPQSEGQMQESQVGRR